MPPPCKSSSQVKRFFDSWDGTASEGGAVAVRALEYEAVSPIGPPGGGTAVLVWYWTVSASSLAEVWGFAKSSTTCFFSALVNSGLARPLFSGFVNPCSTGFARPCSTGLFKPRLTGFATPRFSGLISPWLYRLARS